MGIGLLFAALCALCGVAVTRRLGAHWSLAPLGGLACVAVLTSWAARIGAPPLLGTAIVAVLALAGAVMLVRDAALLAALARADAPNHDSAESAAAAIFGDRVTVAVLSAAVVVPWLLLGVVLAGVQAPVSTHDGAFHVELIDNLRRGVAPDSWYPMGFHSSVAAVLGLVPWVDTARGTVEAAQALSVMAPLGVFALGLAIGLRPRVASVGALVMGLTYIYPYDNQMWAGWPLATSLLLLLGLWATAARWIIEPRVGTALLAGLIAGAIVLTHGTEVYSSVIGLLVIAALRWRSIQWAKLALHGGLAVALAIVCALPYLSTLLGWAATGGASAAGAESLDDVTGQTGQTASGGDWLEFVFGMTGAGSLLDLPLRAGLLVMGALQKRLRLALAGWLAFGSLLFAVSFLDIEPVRRLYVLTFPWLVHHRPPQLVVLFASLLVGAGLVVCVGWFVGLRRQLSAASFRRLSLVTAAFVFFFAEGSSVTIFKTLQQVITDQNVYSADDQAAMAWLRAHATAGEMVINDAAGDAGIWAPYKAGLRVLLPRSGSAQPQREMIARDLTMLEANPAVAAAACAFKADYVYTGSRSVEGDPVVLPDRTALQDSKDLRQVFASGHAAVFRVDLPCAS